MLTMMSSQIVVYHHQLPISAASSASTCTSSACPPCLHIRNDNKLLLWHHPQQLLPSFNERAGAGFSNSFRNYHHKFLRCLDGLRTSARRRRRMICFSAGKEDVEEAVSLQQQPEEDDEEDEDEDEDEDEAPPTPQDLEYVGQIKRVLELLRKNRDMLFGEVKLTIMIEDPREVERTRLLGIEDPDAPTRDDLVQALEQVNEGKVPRNRVALRMLAEEMMSWPNLEAEAPKTKPSKSQYARATETGVDPQEAAKRLKIDWDSAAEIQDADISDDTEVPPAVGYGALYLVTAFPVIIGISVVLILFYNSLQ